VYVRMSICGLMRTFMQAVLCVCACLSVFKPPRSIKNLRRNTQNLMRVCIWSLMHHRFGMFVRVCVYSSHRKHQTRKEIHTTHSNLRMYAYDLLCTTSCVFVRITCKLVDAVLTRQCISLLIVACRWHLRTSACMHGVAHLVHIAITLVFRALLKAYFACVRVFHEIAEHLILRTKIMELRESMHVCLRATSQLGRFMHPQKRSCCVSR
jgi:hypothetical protein